MTSRYLGVISIERLLVVERYRESHQPSSTRPQRSLGMNPAGGRADKPEPRSGSPRHG